MSVEPARLGRQSTSRPPHPPVSLYNDLALALALALSDEAAPLRGGSPSSTMTIRTQDASPHAPILLDDDLFSPLYSTCALHRSSSRLSRWLSEIQSSTATDILDLSHVVPIGTQSNPYLAYPHMSLATLRLGLDDADSIHDYVLVDQDFTLESPPDRSPHDQPSHDSSPPDMSSPRSSIPLLNPQSLRHFHLPRRSVTPSPRTNVSHSPSRRSIFHRPSRSDLSVGATGSYHSRSTSLQTSSTVHALQTPAPPRPSSWRWRPSVLGHFSSASIQDTDTRISPGDSVTDRSRPSMCSSNTCSSITTPTTVSLHEDGESPVPSTPPSKTSSLFGSLRANSQVRGTFFKNDSGSASSPSLRPPYPVSAPHLPGRQTAPPSSQKTGIARLSFASRSRQNPSGGQNQIFVEEPDDSHPHVLFASKSGGPRLSLSLPNSTRQAKKRKLVVSGIALNDTRRLDAFQRWCQSFGEVDQITRMPNGDLHVNFQKAEVADTVCRVRAQVYIAGVGSVHLSWTTGNRRT